MMASVPHIGVAIEQKARLYKKKHNAERSENECEIQLLIKEWPHPEWRLNPMLL